MSGVSVYPFRSFPAERRTSRTVSDHVSRPSVPRRYRPGSRERHGNRWRVEGGGGRRHPAADVPRHRRHIGGGVVGEVHDHFRLAHGLPVRGRWGDHAIPQDPGPAGGRGLRWRVRSWPLQLRSLGPRTPIEPSWVRRETLLGAASAKQGSVLNGAVLKHVGLASRQS